MSKTHDGRSACGVDNVIVAIVRIDFLVKICPIHFRRSWCLQHMHGCMDAACKRDAGEARTPVGFYHGTIRGYGSHSALYLSLNHLIFTGTCALLCSFRNLDKILIILFTVRFVAPLQPRAFVSRLCYGLTMTGLECDFDR